MLIYSVEEPLKIFYTFNLRHAWELFEKTQEKIKAETANYLILTDEDCQIEVKLMENYTSASLETLLLEALNKGFIQFEVSKEVSTWICPV